MRVAIFGASGFAGTAVVERLLAREDVEVLAVIHSDGSAWRLFRRLDLTLRQIDILSRQQVRDLLKDVTHVVNCTRGTDEVMINGLKILLEEAKHAKVQRFVHISSVLIYGDKPSPESVHETAQPDPQNNEYGILKLRQDMLVQAAVKAGLSATIICPPNIIGPYSYLLNGLVTMIKDNQFGLMDEGNSACATVDVVNLAKAIELGLFKGKGNGTRYFVTDNHNTTWGELIEYILPLTGKTDIVHITRQDIEEHIKVPKVSYNPLTSIKHLAASNVREAIRKDPLLCKIDMFFRGLVAKLPGHLEDKVRLKVEGPTRITKVTNQAPISWQFCAAQMRGVFHSCELLQKELDYTPEFTFHESMKAYIRWHNAMRGYDTKFANILKRLT